MLTDDQALAGFIRQTIRETGPVRFDWFMEQVLYHPQLGYYSSGRCQIGRRGDYFTNVSVGPLFGRILAAQFAEMWEILGRPGDFAIVEQGAHHGDFAKDVLEATAERAPDFLAALQYHVVEPFQLLRTRQAETLRGFAGKVRWHNSLDELPPFCGIHFSNELLDSMPVRLISQKGGGEWQEKLVADSGVGFAFSTRPIVDEKLRRYLPNVEPPGSEPYETEVNLTALDWVETVSARLRRGFVLMVDYGFPRSEFYTAERNGGTLQCYSGHRLVASPFRDIGRVDLSAHVDWTSIAERAEECGLSVIGFTDQHHFMTGMLALLNPNESDRRALQTLMHPEFLGTRFQYLVLGKDAVSPELSGFRFARDARRALDLPKSGP